MIPDTWPPTQPSEDESDRSYRRIVLAYNDTPTARRALHHATGLARAHDAELTVLAVQDRLPHYAATRGEVDEELAVEARACRRWLAAARAYADEHSVHTQGETRAGPVARTLTRTARELGADLVVLGAGRRLLARLPLPRTTAGKVERQAPCSVLIIR